MLFNCIDRLQPFLEGIDRERRFVSYSIELGCSNYSAQMLQLCSFHVFEDIFQGCLEYPCNPECERERRRVFPLLQGNDRLTCASGAICQFLLCHFVVFKPKLPDFIPYFSFRHDRSSLSGIPALWLSR